MLHKDGPLRRCQLHTQDERRGSCTLQSLANNGRLPPPIGFCSGVQLMRPYLQSGKFLPQFVLALLSMATLAPWSGTADAQTVSLDNVTPITLRNPTRSS